MPLKVCLCSVIGLYLKHSYMLAKINNIGSSLIMILGGLENQVQLAKCIVGVTVGGGE